MHGRYLPQGAKGKKTAFLTAKDLKNLPPLYSQENERDPVVWVKFFHPYGAGTWLATEFDGQDTFFGATSLRPGEWELGYFSLSELMGLRTRFGSQAIERDIYWTPVRLSEAKGL